MAIPSLMNTGRSGMTAAKVEIATTGHNISNANTEGFSRQRVMTEASQTVGGQFGKNSIGTGTTISRVERINDEYIEKQIRNAQRDLSHYEEKDLSLSQIEDIFNEMNGDGLNRLISRFFNEFRKLSEEPENPAVRQSLRESSQALVNDFHRLRKEMSEVRNHIDQRIAGYVVEVNMLSQELAGLNGKIKVAELNGPPNDLLDKRDVLLKKLGSYFDLAMHKDNSEAFNVDVKGVGPLVTGGNAEILSVDRTPADESGKSEGGLDIRTSGSAQNFVTHSIQGGKFGALIETRDKVIATIMSRLDEMAYSLTESVNQIHRQGLNADGQNGIPFFGPLENSDRAAEFMRLSDEIQDSINNIATGIAPNSPGDNRISIAISRLQGEKMMNDGHATLDEWYDSIVSDVGIASFRNRSALTQEKNIITQLNKVREQISGVSIDEETANLMQFQHAFDASAKVIQVADDLLKTVLSLKRD